MILQVVIDLGTERIAKFAMIDDSIVVSLDSILLCALDYKYETNAKNALESIYETQIVRGEAGKFISMSDARELITMVKENHFGTRLDVFIEGEQKGYGRVRDVLSKA